MDRAVQAAHRLGDEIVIVLVEPRHPGNVGATARAMMNMGLGQLTLVAPSPAFDLERARWMAPGCEELLATVRIVSDVPSALVGVHRAVAATARHRRDKQPVLEPEALARSVFDEPQGRRTAILFGREDFGLSAEDVRHAESVVRIPTPEHASLNLAQAVLLVAHHLFEEARKRGLRADGRIVGGRRGQRSTRSLHRSVESMAHADLATIEPAVEELVSLVTRIGFTRGATPHKLRLAARQALQGADLRVRHVELLRGVVHRVEWALSHPDVDWTATRKR